MEQLGNSGLNWNSLQQYVSIPLPPVVVTKDRCEKQKGSERPLAHKLPLESPTTPLVMLPVVRLPSNMTQMRKPIRCERVFSANE